MARAKISRTQGKTSVVLPDDLAKRLRLLHGDTVYVRETARGFEVTGISPSDDNDIRQAQETVREYKDRWRYAGG